MPTLDIESTRWELECREDGQWTTILKSQDHSNAHQAYKAMTEAFDCPVRLIEIKRSLVCSNHPVE